ncbi:UNKNOWN [Stylonychia lemnae]|uniref:Uncharacterized protein n=1 Tax=Stylonychia lemnae TaxID=5949 RepID=A0A078ALP8_STYLE|nr:UNKNOWN [Stylonychia lemnae]|eukprot:CDW82337.1 UNKNOWN [Stylonychia lemnae]
MQLAFVLLLLLNLSSAKIFAPYCGPKTRDIRFCEKDEDCRYSDEYCGTEQICQTQTSLYDMDPCKDFIYNPSDDDVRCAQVLCPENTYLRPLYIRGCKKDEDCAFSDEYCSLEKYCKVLVVLYVNNPCQNYLNTVEQTSDILCNQVMCPVGCYCERGACYMTPP